MKHMFFKLIIPIMAVALMTACEKETFTDDLAMERAAQVDARASNFNFVATLSGDNEVPPVNTDATGVCVVKIARDESSIDWKLIVANIENVIAAHFHKAPPGVNGGVVVGIHGGLVEDPDGVLSMGTITDADTDLATFIDDIRNGDIYVNVHTTANQGGEIRGQVD